MRATSSVVTAKPSPHFIKVLTPRRFGVGKFASGKRVSNAWATCRKDGDNIPKGVLIPNVVYKAHALYIKGFNPLSDGPASD